VRERDEARAELAAERAKRVDRYWDGWRWQEPGAIEITGGPGMATDDLPVEVHAADPKRWR
jgi:hypothetical protein